MVKAQKLIRVLSIPLIWVFVFSFANAAAAKDLKKVTMGFFGWTSKSWYMAVADKKGFLEAEGLKLDAVVIPSGPGLVQGLVGGSLDIVMMSPESIVRAVDRAGADLITFMGSNSVPVMYLYGSRNIKKLTDLKRKKVGVSNINSQDTLFARMILRGAGVRDNEYDLLPVGGDAERLRGIMAGATDAGMLSSPLIFVAKRNGLVQFEGIDKILKNYQFLGYHTRREWAQKNRPTMISWVRAIERGRQWLMNPANKEEGTNILMSVVKVSKEDALLSYDEIIEYARFFSPEIDIKGYRDLIDQLRDRGDIDKVQDPMRYIDLSFMREAFGK